MYIKTNLKVYKYERWHWISTRSVTFHQIIQTMVKEDLVNSTNEWRDEEAPQVQYYSIKAENFTKIIVLQKLWPIRKSKKLNPVLHLKHPASSRYISLSIRLRATTSFCLWAMNSCPISFWQPLQFKLHFSLFTEIHLYFSDKNKNGWYVYG